MKLSGYPQYSKSFLTCVLVSSACLVASFAEADGAEDAPDTIRVLSFNLWHGGDAGKQPLDRTLEVIQKSRADIVGLQETSGLAPKGEPRPDRAAEIARRLGWHYLDQGGGTGIISRFEIVASTPRKWGARLRLPSGRQLYAFNVHLAHSPYQPYQLLGIPYGEAVFITTEAEAVREAQQARGTQVSEMLNEAKAIASEGLPIVLTGDFNEPSHRDWTESAAKARLCPLKVAWPSTRSVEAAGFIDAYRCIHPDPVESHALTWTPTTKVSDPKDRHDRIDFVYVSGPGRANDTVKDVQIIGESRENADIVVSPYPSDHRAVVAELAILAGKPTVPGR